MHSSYKSRQQQQAMQSAWQAYMRMDPMNCIIDPQNSKGGLYLGNIDAAQNVDMLRRHNIGAVLTVAARSGLKYDKQQMPNHEIIHADDVESYDLSRHFPKMLEFIERNIQNTNVFVHCFAGVSRSSTTVIAYLMKTNNWSYEKAMFYCKSRRKVINPNPGFVRQLLSYERKLREQQLNTPLNKQFDQTSTFSQNSFYQGSGPIRIMPQSQQSNRSEHPHFADTTPKSQKKNLSTTMQQFRHSVQNDQTSPIGRGYGSTPIGYGQPQQIYSQSPGGYNPNLPGYSQNSGNHYNQGGQNEYPGSLKQNYHEQTLAQQYQNQTLGRSSIKYGNSPYADHPRSQSSQNQRVIDNSSQFGGNSKVNQVENINQADQISSEAIINNQVRNLYSNNQISNERYSAKERSQSSKPIYQSQLFQQGYDYVDPRAHERNSSVRASNIYNNPQKNLNHYQSQQNYTNSLRNSYQNAPSYVVNHPNSRQMYGTSFVNLNKVDNRSYQFINSQMTPQSVYSSSYGAAQKSMNYNPKYYPTRRALFSDKPLF